MLRDEKRERGREGRAECNDERLVSRMIIITINDRDVLCVGTHL